jgi:hypothetical protein
MQKKMFSLRMTSQYYGISCSSIRKVLKEFKYKPYKFTNHQQPSNEDKIKRTDFCERLFNLISERDYSSRTKKRKEVHWSRSNISEENVPG